MGKVFSPYFEQRSGSREAAQDPPKETWASRLVYLQPFSPRSRECLGAPPTQPGLRWFRSPEPIHLPGSPSPHLQTAKDAAGARLAAVPESAGRYSSRHRHPGPALLPPSPRPARHPCCCHRAAGSREARATRRCSRASSSPEKGNGVGAPPSGSRPAKIGSPPTVCAAVPSTRQAGCP